MLNILDRTQKFLVETGLVSQKEYDKASAAALRKGTTVLQELLNLGAITEDDAKRIETQIFGLPFVDLSNKKIPLEILSLIPEPIARNRNVVAYEKDGRSLLVAMLDVNDLSTIGFLRQKTGLKIKPHLTNTDSIKSALIQYQRLLKDEFGAVIEKGLSSLKNFASQVSEFIEGNNLQKLAEEPDTVRTVDTLIKHAANQEATDIHLEPTDSLLVVRYRIDGVLHDAMVLPKYAAAALIARLKYLADLDLDEDNQPQNGRFKAEAEGVKIGFRVSVLPTFHGEKIVLRLFKEEHKGFSLEGLGLHGRALENIHQTLKQKSGLILATGSLGMGKTTTIYTLLDQLNAPSVNISTIEDPVEYQLPRVNQTQVQTEKGLTFERGLRSLLLQDPDIIMVGEMNDPQTAQLAANAALSGHMILSTLPSPSVAGALRLLLDMGLEPFLLASTVKLVTSQRLVRALCGSKQAYHLSKKELEDLAELVDLDKVIKRLRAENIIGKTTSWEKVTFYRPLESAECENGYQGRTGIFEALRVSEAIKELINNNADIKALEKQASKEGMLTMREEGIFKAAQGLTTIEEVLQATRDGNY